MGTTGPTCMPARMPGGASCADLTVPHAQARPNVTPCSSSTGRTSQVLGQSARVECAVRRSTIAAMTRWMQPSVPTRLMILSEKNMMGTSASRDKAVAHVSEAPLQYRATRRMQPGIQQSMWSWMLGWKACWMAGLIMRG